MESLQKCETQKIINGKRFQIISKEKITQIFKKNRLTKKNFIKHVTAYTGYRDLMCVAEGFYF